MEINTVSANTKRKTPIISSIVIFSGDCRRCCTALPGKRGIQIEISVIDWKSVHNSVSAFPIAILVGGFPKSQALAGGIAPNIFYNRAILRTQAQAGVIIPVILRKLP